MKGYYINLDERADRREQFESQELPTAFERFVPKRTKPGWKGCRDAHLALMERIDSVTMICEDDCKFYRALKYLKMAMKQLPKDWDMLYLAATLTRPLEKYARNLYLLSDETYEHIIFEGKHISVARFDTEGRVMSLFSFSKSYSMTGWRIGYVVASDEISEALEKQQEFYSSCAPSISQKAAEAALNNPNDCIKEMVEAYHRRRDRLRRRRAVYKQSTSAR